MSKNTKIFGGVTAALLLALAAAWWLGWFKSEDPLVAEIRAAAAEPENEERGEAVRDMFRERTEGMTDEQRMQFFEQMAPVFVPIMMARFEAEYDEFMALSEEERNRKLDERIDEMQRRGGMPGAGGRGGGPQNMDPAAAEAMRKKMLDWVTPEQRGKFQNGVAMFNNRLQERGLPPINMPGGGFF
jgi:hypothetical protein